METKTLIKVMGRNPEFDMLFEYQWLDVRIVTTVYPVYGLWDPDGKLWQAEPRQKGAEIVTYGLLDVDGKRYTCGNPDELAKLGFDPSVVIESKVGHIYPTDGEQPETIDLHP